MQQVCSRFKIKQTLTPVYHPCANMVEGKNRDLKPRLAMQVRDKHFTWIEHLPAILFTMNVTPCETTGCTAAYLTFGRELRTPEEVTNDLRTIVDCENFIPQITPYLRKIADTWKEATVLNKERQDNRKEYADRKHRDLEPYKVGDRVWVDTHILSNTSKQMTSKFVPKRDGPYAILRCVSPVSFQTASLKNPEVPLGVYHISALKPFIGKNPPEPVYEKKRRERLRKPPTDPAPSTGRTSGPGGGTITNIPAVHTAPPHCSRSGRRTSAVAVLPTDYVYY